MMVLVGRKPTDVSVDEAAVFMTLWASSQGSFSWEEEGDEPHWACNGNPPLPMMGETDELE